MPPSQDEGSEGAKGTVWRCSQRLLCHGCLVFSDDRQMGNGTS